MSEGIENHLFTAHAIPDSKLLRQLRGGILVTCITQPHRSSIREFEKTVTEHLLQSRLCLCIHGKVAVSKSERVPNLMKFMVQRQVE